MSESVKANGDAKSPKKGKGTIEKIYQKKSQLEHILLRPDTYIGSVERNVELQWIYDNEAEKMVQKELSYVPGLYKIYDEILVNAADNKQRDKSMDCIKIDINQEENIISVWNNGRGIPVVHHKDENMYVPTMIFGHLLTSSNYNDEEAKVTGGRNGYGAKLCNIFSTKFTVETSSDEYACAFKQTWADNMTKTSEPKIKGASSNDFTKITFSPDLSKFGMEKLEDDIVAIMSRRAYDVAASTRGVKVFLNGKRLPVKDFKSYVDLYIKGKEDEATGSSLKIIYEQPHERWEVAVTTSDRGFQQVSFVNSIATTKGGRHVDNVTDNITKQLLEVLKKKNKGGIQIKPFQVKNHLWVFVNCLIVNPTFDSQTKENMTLQAKNFGSRCTLSDKFITAVSKCGIVESVLSWAKFKEQNELVKKSSGKKASKIKGVPKLEDANEAGGRNALKCTLILTEGDSAKSLVVSGFAVIGRDYYGVFPLRGKLLNVREATHKQILENAEINNIIKILGLQYKKKYVEPADLSTLRYGKLMIMTDQDQDGSHIKGLLINFLHHNWPELLRQEFLEEFITPIVKATKKNQELSFYSLPEFEEWKKEIPNYNTVYKIKYYKGLGTSTSNEAKEYFQNMERHRIVFKYEGNQDDQAITLAFSKKHIENRKDWLTEHMTECRRRKEMGLAERYLYNKDTKSISYAQFINLELILFSNADNVRSIPCLVDGFKPGQRKVIFTCIKRNDKREIKVAQLAGSVAEKSAYHHGEASLCMTIVNLAQNYVGSNNINLLQPNGQFGTRLTGGKDAASPRYIFTMLSPLARLIFHPHDDALLNYEMDDNLKIEPTWYIPIIPMVLVNGADGIGTGWMTKIPNFNPRDLIANIRRMLDGDNPEPMKPWYKNFKGTWEYAGEQRWVCHGEINILDQDKIEITELPIGTWTQVYKENVLEVMLNGNEKTPATITDYKEYNTDTTVRIIVTLANGQMRAMERQGGLHQAFKLTSTYSMSSMVAFDELGCLKKYDDVSDILKEFYRIRLEYYAKRKSAMEGMLGAEASKLSNQARFIVEKCERKIVVENKQRKAMVKELIKAGYDPDPVKTWRQSQNTDDVEDDGNESQADTASQDEEGGDDDGETSSKTDEQLDKEFARSPDVKMYDYLLGMSMWMLTKEKKEQLLRQRDQKIHELNVLKKKTPADIWKEDLNELSVKLDVVEEKERKEELQAMQKFKGKPAKKPALSAKSGRGAKKINLNDTLPTSNAERVIPIISAELKKKVAAGAKTREKKLAKGKSLDTSTEDVKDEFDKLVEQDSKKTLKSKLGGITPEAIEKKVKKEKDGLKQTKLNFKKAPASKITMDSDDDDDDDSDVVRAPVRTVSRRAATKVRTYNLDGDEEQSSGSDVEFKENTAVKGETVTTVVANLVSDSDDEPVVQTNNKQTAESMFDSLIGAAPEKTSDNKMDDDDDKEAKKSTEKRKRPKVISIESDSEDEAPIKKIRTKKTAEKKSKPAAKPKSKKKGSDSDEDFDFESERKKANEKAKLDTVTSRGGGRAKKPAKFVFDDSEDEMSD